MRGDMMFSTGMLITDLNHTKSGPYHDITLSGFYPKISPSISNIFTTMQKDRWVLVALDQNNYKHLIGNKYSGAEFSFNASTRKLNDATLNGYDIKFTWQSLTPPLFYLPAEEDAYLIPDETAFTPTAYQTTFYFYNSSDAGIQAAPPDLYQRLFSVLEGKSITDFLIIMGNIPLIANDPDAADNQITAIDPDGTVTFKNKVPANTQIFIIVKI